MKKFLVLLALCLSANVFALKIGDLYERENGDLYYPQECIVTNTSHIWGKTHVYFREWKESVQGDRIFLLESGTFEGLYREIKKELR